MTRDYPTCVTTIAGDPYCPPYRSESGSSATDWTGSGPDRTLPSGGPGPTGTGGRRTGNGGPGPGGPGPGGPGPDAPGIPRSCVTPPPRPVSGQSPEITDVTEPNRLRGSAPHPTGMVTYDGEWIVPADSIVNT